MPKGWAVASLTVPGEQEFHFPRVSSNFDQFFIFFLKLYLFSSSFWPSRIAHPGRPWLHHCPKEYRIFTQFLVSQNVAILSWLVMLVGLMDIEHMQSVIKCFNNCWFAVNVSDLEIQKTTKPWVKIKLFWYWGTFKFWFSESLSSVSELNIQWTMQDNIGQNATVCKVELEAKQRHFRQMKANKRLTTRIISLCSRNIIKNNFEINLPI